MSLRFAPLTRSLRLTLGPLRRDGRGNVMAMTALAIIPLVFATGFGVDYSRAQRLQTKLNAAADAAVLAAVVPQMLNQTDAAAQSAAQNMFDQQVNGLSGLSSISRTVTISSTQSGSLGTLRVAKITYTAISSNIFSSILHVPTLPIGGSASASASQPPSINFYIALDTSPSMLLPTTTTGITNLTAGARWNGEQYYYGRVDGCDFACHSNNMHQWNAGTYVVDSSSRPIYLNNNTSSSITFYRVACDGTVYDNNGTKLGTGGSISGSATYCSGYNPAANPVNLTYLPTGASKTTTVSVNFPDTWWLARNYSTVNPGQSAITLRTDAEGDAAASVIQYAYRVEQQYATASVPPIYKMQFFTFNVGNPAPLSTSPFGTMTDVATLQGLTFPNMGAQAPLLAANSYWTNLSTYTGNADTNFTSMFAWMQSTMPSTSGSGTQASPQNVLILVTDGLEDDNTGDGITQLNANNISQCNAIKATGTRIAILYTQYLPATINYTLHPTFNSTAANNVPYIQQQLQACASQNADGTYLFQTVSTDGSVSTALNTLFAMVVQSARLVK